MVIGGHAARATPAVTPPEAFESIAWNPEILRFGDRVSDAGV
jgi:hypothetical protein